MAILLVHLDKKLRISAETLDDTNEKIKSLEDSAAIFRYPKNPVNVQVIITLQWSRISYIEFTL